jgi:hypothetical protein
LAIPRFNVLILRRTMPELRRSHLQEVPFDAEKLGLGPGAWHATNYELRFPNGSKITFGHVEDEKTVSVYLSSEYDEIIFDELCTFTLSQFLFISSRARSSKADMRGKEIVRAGTNPIGVGAGWVKKLFIDQNVSPEELPGYNANDYENIVANLDDNPYLSDEYAKSLMSLPTDALRRAMRHGEWVVEGQFFHEFTPMLNGEPWHVIENLPTFRGRPILEVCDVVRAVDWGYSKSGNPGYCGWFVILPDHSAILFQEYVFRETLPADAAREILRRSMGMTVKYTVGDSAMMAEHSGPSIAEHFAAAGLSLIEADKSRETGWIAVHNWLQEIVDDGVHRYPRLRFLKDGVPHAIRVMPEMVVDPRNPADMTTKGVEDDPPDVIRYFVMSRPGRSATPMQDVNPAIMEMLRRAERKTKSHWAPNVL